MTTQVWKPIEYSHKGAQLVVDGTRLPFDESPILLHTRFGVIEASWVPSKGHGEDAEGFYFEDAHGKIYDLDDVRFLAPVAGHNVFGRSVARLRALSGRKAHAHPTQGRRLGRGVVR